MTKTVPQAWCRVPAHIQQAITACKSRLVWLPLELDWDHRCVIRTHKTRTYIMSRDGLVIEDRTKRELQWLNCCKMYAMCVTQRHVITLQRTTDGQRLGPDLSDMQGVFALRHLEDGAVREFSPLRIWNAHCACDMDATDTHLFVIMRYPVSTSPELLVIDLETWQARPTHHAWNDAATRGFQTSQSPVAVRVTPECVLIMDANKINVFDHGGVFQRVLYTSGEFNMHAMALGPNHEVVILQRFEVQPKHFLDITPFYGSKGFMGVAVRLQDGAFLSQHSGRKFGALCTHVCVVADKIHSW